MVLALLVYAQLDALYDRVAADLRAGKPLSARVHVALCDNSMLACGNARLGDGDNLNTNLYWGTSEGFRGWFTRRGSGWRLERRERPSEGEVLERSIWTRTVPPGARWRRRGITRPIPVRVEVLAWRGRAIDHAIERYMLDLWNDPSMHVVAYIGHDRWMDRDDIAWPRAEPQNVKGTMALACKTSDYVAEHVRAVPLVMTNDFVFASAPAFDRALVAFAEGADLGAIREAAARGYAEGEGKPVGRVRSAFRAR